MCKFGRAVDVSPELGTDVLAQPTRARLFKLLSELKRPGETVELAESLRLHPNGIRAHLERMEGAGLVARARAPQARGRPRDAWTIAPGARPGGEPPQAYADLGRWLARAIAPRARSLRDVQAAGREIGRELAPRDAATGSIDALHTSLAALGFEPRIAKRTTGQTRICLNNCPYRDVVRENQPVICTLHRGMTIGLLDVLDGDAELTDFIPHDPDTAGCTIEISGPSASATVA